MYVEYDSNNSGGRWWLTDDDWRKLEEAGWEVVWGARPKIVQMREAEEAEEWPKTYAEAKAQGPEFRWLRALARTARLDVGPLEPKDFTAKVVEVVKAWEVLVDQEASDEGCNCCGPPHTFALHDDDDRTVDSWSGDSIVDLLYNTTSMTYREAVSRVWERDN